MNQHQLRLCLSALALVGCKPQPEPTPPVVASESETPVPQEEEVAALADCSDSYDVDAQIVDGARGLELEQLIDGTVITDDAPFTCELPSSASRSQFVFAGTVTKADCPYTMSYVNDGTGESFTGSVSLDCATSELDYTATATPDASNPKCSGASRLVDDPKIKLNRNNCGTDVD